MAGSHFNSSKSERVPATYDFAAKGSRVGGGQKNCVKGKSCSATCIAREEDCLVELGPELQTQVRKMAQFIVAKREKEGSPIQAGSQEDIDIGKATELVGGQLKKEGTYQRGTGKYKKEVKERTFDTSTRGQTRLISPSEIRDLKANRDKLGNAEFDEAARKVLQKEVNSRGVSLDRKSLELVYDSLPVAAKTALNTSGNPGKGKWYGKDKDGNEVTNLNNGSRDRGLAVLDMYVRQGGRDAYGSGKGRVMSPADFDVEHIRPASKGGLDHPSNWILARSGAQRQRADKELGKWIDSLPNPSDRAAMNKYYTNFAKKEKTRAAAKAVAASVNPRSLSDAELVKVSPKNLRYMFDRDSFFQSGFYSTGGGGNRLTGSPPVPVSKAYGLVRKHNEDAAKDVRAQTKQIYNKDWFEKGGNTQKMTDDMINLYKKNMPAESFRAIEPALKKWQSETVAAFPSGPPRVIGGSSQKPSLDSLISSVQGKPASAAPASLKPKTSKPKAAAKPKQSREERLSQAKQQAQALVNMYVSQNRSPAQIRDLLKQQKIPASIINEVV